MENKLIITDYRFKLSANCICITEVTEWLGANLNKVRTRQHENLKNNSTKGQLSPKALQRIKKAVNWLIISSEQKQSFSHQAQKKHKFKVNFITLTIPPQKKGLVKEKQFKELLNTWLTYHRKYNKLNNYVWKLEYHKDGRLHIHLTTDTFIHWQKIRDSWNAILKRASLLEQHNAKFNNYNPNSTDVHAVKKIKKIGAYIAKYMAKNNPINEQFRGRVWGCSSKITQVINNVVYVCPSKIYEVTRHLQKSKAKYLKVESNPNQFGTRYKVADIWLMNVSDWISLKGGYLYSLFQDLIYFLRKETSRDSQLEMKLI